MYISNDVYILLGFFKIIDIFLLKFTKMKEKNKGFKMPRSSAFRSWAKFLLPQQRKQKKG